MQRAQRGDEKAFEELVVLCDHQVLNVAYSMTGSLTDAQDIYQDTFMRAYSSIHGFRFQSSFRTWVMRIAMNQAINWRRKRKLRSFLPLDSNEDNMQHIDWTTDANPTNSMYSGEILSQIRAAMDMLSAKERAIFTLRHFQEIKIKEIAHILGCAEGTVKNLLFRATKKMQKALQNYVEA